MSSTFPDPPVLTPYNATTPPPLPVKFHAVALVTGFTDDQLVVADVWYDWSVQSMRVTLYGLEGGYADALYTPKGVYLLDSVNGQDPKQCFGPAPSPDQVPAPNWLTNYGVQCRGAADVLGVDTSWWCGLTKCTNGCANPPPPPNLPVANWFWFRTDNQLPWRMMFINQTNDYKLPLLGYNPILHFPTFQAVASTNLPGIVQECLGDSQPLDNFPPLNSSRAINDLLTRGGYPLAYTDQAAMTRQIQVLIPGLSYAGGTPLPWWPPRLFLTSFTTPTYESGFPNQPYPTQVYYDSTIQRQLTRFFLPGNTLEDAILTNSQTNLVARLPDGSHKCLVQLPVGLPYPDWPTRDGAVCKGVIVNNPQLSPGRTTNIFVMPSSPPRIFWIWYTSTNVALMFAEVPQACDVKLVLTDYFDYDPAPPPFDPSLFVVPPDCLSK